MKNAQKVKEPMLTNPWGYGKYVIWVLGSRFWV